MIDATRLLGSVFEHRATPSATNRLDSALGAGSAGGGNPLQQILSQLRGGAGAQSGGGGFGDLLSSLSGSGGGQAGLGGMLGGLADMAKRAASSPRQEVGRNNPVAIGGLGALAGTLFGGGRGAIGGGLLAVLGSLAYSALQANQPGNSTPAASTNGPEEGFAPSTPEEMQHTALLVLRSMIQAAKADGQIDAKEIEHITGKLRESGEDSEAHDFVLQQMSGPADIEGIAREARTPKEAAEAYAASLMAIKVDTQAEKDYLARLAGALGLSKGTVDYIHNSLGVPA